LHSIVILVHRSRGTSRPVHDGNAVVNGCRLGRPVVFQLCRRSSFDDLVTALMTNLSDSLRENAQPSVSIYTVFTARPRTQSAILIQQCRPSVRLSGLSVIRYCMKTTNVSPKSFHCTTSRLTNLRRSPPPTGASNTGGLWNCTILCQ